MTNLLGTDVTIPKKEDKDQRVAVEGTKEGVASAKAIIDRIVGFKVNTTILFSEVFFGYIKE